MAVNLVFNGGGLLFRNADGSETATDVVTELVLGGDVWKQFRGFRNPHEVFIEVVLDTKKKFAQRFNQFEGNAKKQKSEIEALMAKIQAMDGKSPPPGISYGGFTTSEEQPLP